jgi:3',5'-cyclic AMP phosphodiesterase CpdA
MRRRSYILIAVCVAAALAYGGIRLARRAAHEEAVSTPSCNPTASAVCLIPGLEGEDTGTLLPQMTLALPPAATVTVTAAEVAQTPTAAATSVPALTLPASESLALLAGPYLGEVTGSTVAVSWVTHEAAAFVVRYGLPGGALRESAATSTASPAGCWHSAVLTALEPGTTYRYTVQTSDGRAASQEMTVTTAPAAGTDHFTFLVLGDSRPGDRITAQPSTGARNVAAQVATEQFSLALHTGDMVGAGGVCSGELSGWEQYLRAYLDLFGDSLSRAPWYVMLGNHEFAGGSCGDDIYRTVFSLPRNAPSGDEERYYSFDWGNAHFTVLDGYLDFAAGSAQYAWLERDLASATQRWKFVFFHEPVYSSGEHGPSLDEQQVWVPLFEQYGVDVAFAGHDHIYERTCPILQGACTTVERGGVVYFVTGGAGAPLYDTKGGWFSLARASVNHYLTVEVRGCALYFTATDGDGNVIDRYELDSCA